MKEMLLFVCVAGLLALPKVNCDDSFKDGSLGKDDLSTLHGKIRQARQSNAIAQALANSQGGSADAASFSQVLGDGSASAFGQASSGGGTLGSNIIPSGSASTFGQASTTGGGFLGSSLLSGGNTLNFGQGGSNAGLELGGANFGQGLASGYSLHQPMSSGYGMGNVMALGQESSSKSLQSQFFGSSSSSEESNNYQVMPANTGVGSIAGGGYVPQPMYTGPNVYQSGIGSADASATATVQANGGVNNIYGQPTNYGSSAEAYASANSNSFSGFGGGIAPSSSLPSMNYYNPPISGPSVNMMPSISNYRTGYPSSPDSVFPTNPGGLSGSGPFDTNVIPDSAFGARPVMAVPNGYGSLLTESNSGLLTNAGSSAMANAYSSTGPFLAGQNVYDQPMRMGGSVEANNYVNNNGGSASVGGYASSSIGGSASAGGMASSNSGSAPGSGYGSSESMLANIYGQPSYFGNYYNGLGGASNYGGLIDSSEGQRYALAGSNPMHSLRLPVNNMVLAEGSSQSSSYEEANKLKLSNAKSLSYGQVNPNGAPDSLAYLRSQDSMEESNSKSMTSAKESVKVANFPVNNGLHQSYQMVPPV